MKGDTDGSAIQEPQRTVTGVHPDVNLLYANCGLPSEDFDHLPKFDLTELKFGKVLGKGGFGIVYEVCRFHFNKEACPEMCHRMEALNSRNDDDSAIYLQDSCVAFTEQVCRRKRQCSHSIKGATSYALKTLKPELLFLQGISLLKGVADLAIEAKMLSKLEHPHIIRLRGLSNACPFSPGFFLIIDKLHDTLRNKVRQWDEHVQQLNRILGNVVDTAAGKRAPLYQERLRVACDLASAIEYLHGHRIVYRDIKQDNFGFDMFGKIKLFDFGLARALPSEEALCLDGTYSLTGVTGSPRYMAPEVANSKRYNASCDTYSFAILLWELLVLRDAFAEYTLSMMQDKVYNASGNRPPIDPSWSDAIKELVSQCWSPNWKERWNMFEIVQILQLEIVDCGEAIMHVVVDEQPFSKKLNSEEEISSSKADRTTSVRNFPPSISKTCPPKLLP